ncbi:hypothetical protein P3W45_000319 [Vairimorpha bombi]|jgi:diacylglycerol diphosphate phosphatase / phosphatidate phosphatase
MKIDKLVFSIALISSFLILLSLIYSPRNTELDLNSRNIRKKHKLRDSISIEVATCISIVVPITFFVLCFRCVNIELEQELQFYVCFLTCHLALTAFVENTKNIVGRLRPDFFNRCKPVMNRCTGNKKVVADGRKSFPSGHSAITSCGFVYMVSFLNSKFVRQLNNKIINNNVSRLFLSFIFLTVPLVVGASRYFDNKHFISDILGGFLAGGVCASFFYRYFGEQLLKNNIEY